MCFAKKVGVFSFFVVCMKEPFEFLTKSRVDKKDI